MQRTFGARILRKIRNLPSELALKVINVPFIERSLRARYERALAAHKKSMPALTDTDVAIVAALKRDGVCLTSLAALSVPGTEEMLASGCEIGENCSRRKHEGAYQGWETVMAGADEIVNRPAIFTWGLQQRLLDIVENYLGLPVAYDGLNLFYTIADGRQAGSRKWHRDREDRRMIKIAVYCNDVDDNGGPLQVLRRGVISSDLEGSFRYPVLSQEQLTELLGRPPTDDEVITCKGQLGTVIFCDTARQYHRGKPAVSSDRCAIFYNYFARVPRHPFFCDRSGLSREQISGLIADLSPAQRACAQWVESLPAYARMVPKNVF